MEEIKVHTKWLKSELSNLEFGIEDELQYNFFDKIAPRGIEMFFEHSEPWALISEGDRMAIGFGDAHVIDLSLSDLIDQKYSEKQELLEISKFLKKKIKEIDKILKGV